MQAMSELLGGGARLEAYTANTFSANTAKRSEGATLAPQGAFGYQTPHRGEFDFQGERQRWTSYEGNSICVSR